MSSKRKKELYQELNIKLHQMKQLQEEIKNIQVEIQYLEAHQNNEYRNQTLSYRKGKR